MLEAERERTRGRDAILAGASAEVLAPISALTGLLLRLRATPPEERARREMVESAMVRELAQLRHLAGQFLDYARLKSGRSLVVEPRATELAPIVEQAARAFPAGANVQYELPDELPAVDADPGRVLQILLSLVTNAVKFSPAHALVTIAAELRDDGLVAITVSDQGTGIPAAEQARIFDELERGENVGDAEGVGLGLYLCRLLAEAHGGTITVVSELGKGSSFTVTLPPALERASARRPLRRLRPLH